jgi:sugar phosphate isomerase/epimerase
MNRLKLGLRLESLDLPLRPALTAAARLGVAGVQVDAVGDLSPNQLSQTGRREFRNLLRAHNLELTAVGCPLRRGLDVAQDQQPRLEHVQKVLTLSFDLGPRVVVVQAGRLPDEAEEKTDSPRPRLLRESLLVLSGHGDRTGTRLALETGLESGAALRDYLQRFDTGSLAVNYDPANLLMNGFDPIAGLRALAGRLAHAHAKDARAANPSRSAREVPVGAGDLDWMAILAGFEEVDYHGWLVVEREGGDDRLSDVTAGLGFLRRLAA